MAKVILQGFIVVPDSDLEAFKSEVVTHKSLTLKEAGCLNFIVTPDEVNPNKFDESYQFSLYKRFHRESLGVVIRY